MSGDYKLLWRWQYIVRLGSTILDPDIRINLNAHRKIDMFECHCVFYIFEELIFFKIRKHEQIECKIPYLNLRSPLIVSSSGLTSTR